MKNDAITAQMINTELPMGSMGLTSFKWSNAEIITTKTPINVPTNESIVNANLNIDILKHPHLQGYTIDLHHHSNDDYHKSQTLQ